jgi:hypothetical protein
VVVVTVVVTVTTGVRVGVDVATGFGGTVVARRVGVGLLVPGPTGGNVETGFVAVTVARVGNTGGVTEPRTGGRVALVGEPSGSGVAGVPTGLAPGPFGPSGG